MEDPEPTQVKQAETLAQLARAEADIRAQLARTETEKAEAARLAAAEAEKAALTLAMAEADPIEVARQNAALRSSVRGAHALLYALVERAGGFVTVPAAAYRFIPAGTDLKVHEMPNGDVEIRIVRAVNTAIRPKKGRKGR